MIQIEKLNKSFGKNHILKDISLTLESPKVVAILGPNGSGKTTLLNCLLGIVIPDSGSISIDDTPILGKHIYREDIAYLSQVAALPENLTGREYIQLMKSLKKKPAIDSVFIEMFDLQEQLDKKMRNLSGGNRQKINITASLMHQDPIVILDEPSTGLDPLSLQRFKHYLKQRREAGDLILITTHIMSLAEEIAEEVLFILEGEIYFSGALRTLLEHHHSSTLEESIAYILNDNTLIQK